MGPSEAKAAGVIFYSLPGELTPDMVDPLIRKAVFRINDSGWVWTAESCQGHPDALTPAWAGNNRPMLRLVCQRKYLGQMLALLLDAARYPDRDDGDYPRPSGVCGLQIFNSWEAKGLWSEVLVYIQADNTYERNLGLEVYERFAEAVNDQRPSDP